MYMSSDHDSNSVACFSTTRVLSLPHCLNKPDTDEDDGELVCESLIEAVAIDKAEEAAVNQVTVKPSSLGERARCMGEVDFLTCSSVLCGGEGFPCLVFSGGKEVNDLN